MDALFAASLVETFRGAVQAASAGIIAYSSAGTPLGSDLDFASGYLRHILGFLGITDVEFVAADRLAMDREAGLARARQAVDNLAA